MSEERFRALLNSAPDAVVVIDDSGVIVFVNEQAETLFKYSASELIGRPLEVLLPERLRETHVGNRRRFLVDPHPRPMGVGLELAGRRSDATEFPVDVSIGSIASPRDGPLAMAFIRDISARRGAETALAAANLEIAQRAAELERRNSDMLLVSQMGNLLQSCSTMDQAFDVLARFARELFADVSGEVYLRKSGDLLEAVAKWGTQQGTNSFFSSDDCWALRRGLPHRGGEVGLQPWCSHVDDYRGEYVCVPMIAQSQSIGIVHLRRSDAGAKPVDDHEWESVVNLAIAMAEDMALALANLSLRESLRHQSIRDPLTNLFNRRFLDEYLEGEIRRAARSVSPVSVIMLDVDHFKVFNDEHGHSIGDSVLVSLARLIESSLRGGDVACRHGGEEFVLVLPDAPLEGAAKRAEQIRKSMANLVVPGASRAIHISLGIATYPMHATTSSQLLEAADNALYLAKSQGRDRVVIQPLERADETPIHVWPDASDRAGDQQAGEATLS